MASGDNIRVVHPHSEQYSDEEWQWHYSNWIAVSEWRALERALDRTEGEEDGIFTTTTRERHDTTGRPVANDARVGYTRPQHR